MPKPVTVVGDPHLKPNNLETFKILADKVESLDTTHVVWLGDMLDTKEVVRGKCLNTWYNYFESSNKHHIVLVGNHDWFNLDCIEHSLEPLKSIENVTIVDSIRKNLLGCHFMPYHSDNKVIRSWISEIKKVDDNPVLFCHVDMKNFDYGNGFICENGLTTRTFSSFKRVISGHFHKYQTKNNFMYLGTPFSHSFGESNQDKYIANYNIEKDKLDLISTLDFLPTHRTIKIDCNKSIDLNDVKYNSKDFTRIILSGSQERIDKFKAKNLDKLNNDVKVIEKADEDKKRAKSIDETLSNEIQFKTWAENIKKLDPETIEIGRKILGSIDA